MLVSPIDVEVVCGNAAWLVHLLDVASIVHNLGLGDAAQNLVSGHSQDEVAGLVGEKDVARSMATQRDSAPVEITVCFWSVITDFPLKKSW